MTPTPDMMPVLSRGRHRNPRKGACFMEMASYLAGEKWSDHPECTHPLLAALARDVNDLVGDGARSRIAPLIPDVVGLRHEDPRSYAWIAREAALAALPVAPMARQRVAAVGLIRCEQMLDVMEGRPETHIGARARAALDQVPHARDWARDFLTLGTGSPRTFTRRSAPAIVHASVSGIASAAVDDADARLVDLLEHTIGQCRVWFLEPQESAERVSA